MTKYIFFGGFIFLLAMSCTDLQEHNKQNMQKVAKEMKMREFKKISETEMIVWVNEEGQKITQFLQRQFEKDIQKKNKKNDNPAKIISQYNASILDSLKKAYPVEIKKISFQSYAEEKLYATEKEVLEAYLYALDKKAPLSDNYQKLHNEVPTKFLFTSPIKLGDKYIGMWSLVFPKSSVISNFAKDN